MEESGDSLVCRRCGADYRVVEGIPVLLPARFSNADELELRRRVTLEAQVDLDHLRERYDRYHFRRLAEDRLRAELDRRPGGGRVAALDIGIGWGCPWLRFANELDLVGLDFSLESLLLLQQLFRAEGARVPLLVCGSLSAIPLAGVQFDLVTSTQVYQHIPDDDEVAASFAYVIDALLKPEGTFVVDNLNYGRFRLPLALKRLLRGRRPLFGTEAITAGLYLHYYRREDFARLMSRHPSVSWNVAYTETLMQPQQRLTPRSERAARVDRALARTPLAPAIARQITLEARKRPA